MEHRSNLPCMDITTLQTSPDERIWSGNYSFIHCADTQFGMIDKFMMKGPKGDPGWDKEIELSTEMINNINKMKPIPRFIVICGDMLDSFPYPGSPVKLREKQYTDFVKTFRNLNPSIKLICICGNHDIGDEPTKESLALYRKQFGPDFFSYWTGGVKFVVLNSQYFKTPDCLLDEVKLHAKFMETIHDSTAKHIVVFQHIPYFLEKSDEKDSKYFNITKDLRLQILGQLKNEGVSYIFCGHYHRNASGTHDGIEHIVTSAVGAQLGDDHCGYRVVKVFEDKITNEYINLSRTYNFKIAELDID